MNRFIILSGLFMLLILFSSASQNNVQINEENTPTENRVKFETEPIDESYLSLLRIAHKGIFIEGAKWKDSQGNHLVFCTATGLYESRKEDPGDGMSSEIFAYHYVYQDNPDHAATLWTFEQAELNCPLATLTEFIDGSFTITDLNDDGVAEVWLAYRGGCSGDITPWEMSIVMYEGDKKYSLSGDVKITLPGGTQLGGQYTFDRDFGNLPDVFKDFADELWKKHCFYFNYFEDQ